MEKIQTTRRVEKLLLEGKTKEAIDQVLDYLECYNLEESSMYNEIIQIKAQFLRAKRRRSMGIVSAKREGELVEEVNMEIRYFLDYLNGKSPMRKRTWWMKIPNYGYVLAMGSAFILSLFTYHITQQNSKKEILADCPKFDLESEFNIVILPLDNELEDTERSMQIRVKERFDLYIDSMNLAISIGLSGLSRSNERYPNNVMEASNIATNCDAQLILWADDQYVHYKFMDQDDFFEFYQLYPGNKGEFIPIPHTTLIATVGKIDRKSNPTVLNYLLGTAANQIEDYSSAVQLMRTPMKDSAQNIALLRSLQLADSEMEVNNATKAIDAYDMILDLRPEYDFARLNRSVLCMNAQRFEESIRDLNFLLDTNPNNSLALYTQGRVLAKMEQLKEAEFVFTKLNDLLLQDSTRYHNDVLQNIVRKTMSDLARKKYEAQKAGRIARQELRAAPEDSTLQHLVLKHYIQLGEDGKAQKLLEDFIPTDPSILKMINARSLALEAVKENIMALFWKSIIPPDYSEIEFVTKETVQDTQVL